MCRIYTTGFYGVVQYPEVRYYRLSLLWYSGLQQAERERERNRLLKQSKKEGEESEESDRLGEKEGGPEVDPCIGLKLVVMAGHTSA